MIYYCPVCSGTDFDLLENKPDINDFKLTKKKLDVYHCAWCGETWLIHKLKK